MRFDFDTLRQAAFRASRHRSADIREEIVASCVEGLDNAVFISFGRDHDDGHDLHSIKELSQQPSMCLPSNTIPTAQVHVRAFMCLTNMRGLITRAGPLACWLVIGWGRCRCTFCECLMCKASPPVLGSTPSWPASENFCSTLLYKPNDAMHKERILDVTQCERIRMSFLCK